ncbi:ArnT family glycosyltransferase [Asanoa iriomotensis]|uniref:Dolichyl-phosphate-mannose-protein mannosyltransferase n=1 Tax=Asanoa iriomotensis TaxID=234613 RepID=A0ABQ4BXN9_9ACTN|nr:glycosyltransferase family 39 protein [Asanoa iriomotensis]GIF55278.1 hypothetical protein Air01nite_13730 [Asanoa iriomotensis]
MTLANLAPTDVRQLLSVRRRLLIGAQEWLRRHAHTLTVLAPILVVTALVRGIGMSTFPRYVDDPGTYLSQAWSLQYEGTLSPYSYFYDHAPAGWIQIALWSMLTDGFDRHDSAIGFGNECMLIAGVVSTALVFALGRRLGFSRWVAGLATVLFALSPLAVLYGRWTFLDNLATPWLLAAFVLALSPKRSILAGTGAALCFAMAALTKETLLVLLPALAWALWRNTDPRNRAQVLTVAAGAGALLMALYPLFALFKGELFEGPGHNSLLGTAAWQLAERESSGSLLTADSPMRDLFSDWLAQDKLLLLGGLASVPVAVFAGRLRPIALTLVIGWLLMVRDGYVPFMHVITLLPWSALLIAGAVHVVAGSDRRWRVGAAAALAVVVLAVAAITWPGRLAPMMTTRDVPTMRAAELWVADNVPRDKVLVVHDSIWVDLVHRYRFEPRPIMVSKLDTDPAVQERLTRIDYLVVPEWYVGNPSASPTLVEAHKHAVPVASFGDGSDGVRVYRVSRYWSP